MATVCDVYGYEAISLMKRIQSTCDINAWFDSCFKRKKGIADNDDYRWFYDWQCENAELPAGVYAASGCTRMVFWEEDSDFVYKVAIDPTECDYSKSEVFIYNHAVDEGLEEFFAWTAKAAEWETEYGIVPIYVMRRCECDSDALTNSSYRYAYSEYCREEGYDEWALTDEQKDDVDNHVDWDECGDTESILNYIYEVYGRRASDLIDFIDRYNINDTHAGNWGTYNGALILIDYGGYGRDITKMEEYDDE